MTVVDPYEHGGDAQCEMSRVEITAYSSKTGSFHATLVLLEHRAVILLISNILR